MIVYKELEHVLNNMADYRLHRVVDDHRMTKEVAVTPTLWMRLKHYLMGEVVPLTHTEPRMDVRITPTSLYAHPKVADVLRLRQGRIERDENPFVNNRGN